MTNEQPSAEVAAATGPDRESTGAGRVVSLVPSATETLLAWGVTPVACTKYCEQPGIATVGGTKNPDLAAIVDLAPDLVVMDEEENRREDHDALVAAGISVQVLAVRAVADVAPQLLAFADRLGVDPGPLHRVDGPPPPARAKAFVPIWRRPWMALGPDTYGASLLARLGVAVVPAGGRYDEVDLDAVAAEQPDVVVAPSEPYRFSDAHLEELASVAPTVRVDGQDLFWWGVRTGPAIDRLAMQLEAVLTRDREPPAP